MGGLYYKAWEVEWHTGLKVVFVIFLSRDTKHTVLQLQRISQWKIWIMACCLCNMSSYFLGEKLSEGWVFGQFFHIGNLICFISSFLCPWPATPLNWIPFTSLLIVFCLIVFSELWWMLAHWFHEIRSPWQAILEKLLLLTGPFMCATCLMEQMKICWLNISAPLDYWRYGVTKLVRVSSQLIFCPCNC